MTNTVIELIKKHGSIRKYRDQPVPKQDIEEIIRAAQRTSTSSNLQTYSVIVIEDEVTRSKLPALCGNQAFTAQAPVFLVWCADNSRLDRVCQAQGYEQSAEYLETFLVAAVDAALASQSAALAAESMGYGICYIGSLRNEVEKVMELLALPDLVFPIFGMTLGVPVEQPMIRPRLPLEAVLHWETYNPEDGEYLQDYDQAMIKTGIYAGRQVKASSEEQVEERAYGWMEHSARRAALTVRMELTAILRKIGYGLK